MCAPRGKNLVLQVTMPSLEKMLMSSSIQQEELQSLRSKVNDPYLSLEKIFMSNTWLGLFRWSKVFTFFRLVFLCSPGYLWDHAEWCSQAGERFSRRYAKDLDPAEQCGSSSVVMQADLWAIQSTRGRELGSKLSWTGLTTQLETVGSWNPFRHFTGFLPPFLAGLDSAWLEVGMMYPQALDPLKYAQVCTSMCGQSTNGHSLKSTRTAWGSQTGASVTSGLKHVRPVWACRMHETFILT